MIPRSRLMEEDKGEPSSLDVGEVDDGIFEDEEYEDLSDADSLGDGSAGVSHVQPNHAKRPTSAPAVKRPVSAKTRTKVQSSSQTGETGEKENPAVQVNTGLPPRSDGPLLPAVSGPKTRPLSAPANRRRPQSAKNKKLSVGFLDLSAAGGETDFTDADDRTVSVIYEDSDSTTFETDTWRSAANRSGIMDLSEDEEFEQVERMYHALLERREAKKRMMEFRAQNTEQPSREESVKKNDKHVELLSTDLKDIARTCYHCSRCFILQNSEDGACLCCRRSRVFGLRATKPRSVPSSCIQVLEAALGDSDVEIKPTSAARSLIVIHNLEAEKYIAAGSFNEAFDHLEQAQALCSKKSPFDFPQRLEMAAWTCDNLTRVHLHARKYADALSCAVLTLKAAKRTGLNRLKATARCHLSFIYSKLGKHVESLKHARDALNTALVDASERERDIESEGSATVADVVFIAVCHHNIAVQQLFEGDYGCSTTASVCLHLAQKHLKPEHPWLNEFRRMLRVAKQSFEATEDGMVLIAEIGERSSPSMVWPTWIPPFVKVGRPTQPVESSSILQSTNDILEETHRIVEELERTGHSVDEENATRFLNPSKIVFDAKSLPVAEQSVMVSSRTNLEKPSSESASKARGMTTMNEQIKREIRRKFKNGDYSGDERATMNLADLHDLVRGFKNLSSYKSSAQRRAEHENSSKYLMSESSRTLRKDTARSSLSTGRKGEAYTAHTYGNGAPPRRSGSASRRGKGNVIDLVLAQPSTAGQNPNKEKDIAPSSITSARDGPVGGLATRRSSRPRSAPVKRDKKKAALLTKYTNADEVYTKSKASSHRFLSLCILDNHKQFEHVIPDAKDCVPPELDQEVSGME